MEFNFFHGQIKSRYKSIAKKTGSRKETTTKKTKKMKKKKKKKKKKDHDE